MYESPGQVGMYPNVIFFCLRVVSVVNQAVTGYKHHCRLLDVVGIRRIAFLHFSYVTCYTRPFGLLLDLVIWVFSARVMCL